MGNGHEWAERFAGLADSLYPADAGAIAQRAVAAATELVPACDDAALCLMDRHGRPVPAAASGEATAAAHRTWHTAGDGPCFATIRTGAVHPIPDLRRNGRWPAASRHAAERAPICGVLILPVKAGPDVLGALMVAERSGSAAGPATIALGGVLATHTAVALAGAAGRARGAELTEALRSSRLIGMAVGIVMARRRLTPEQAFDLLRRHSRRGNGKIRELALEILHTGRLPDD
ncbi:GAF and ANTAR domain-containing protein [Actinoplanes sp. NPDC049596]|uniref:GAF and ANTAR domain-containing protein n=1 Tax=unclassified Actinoplanes TaxID=2626549 RepID=UPI00341DBA15